ncbi:MAG: PX domain-containing protein [archaeon]|nr:PX domain-containing protein [archaeon]
MVGVKLQDTEKGGKSHHDFVIRCQTSNGGVWEVFRRFRNFVALNAALCSSEPWWMEVSNLPPKKVFGHLEEEFVNKRRNALQIYIYTLEKYEPIVRHPEFLLFLDPRTPNPAEYSERRWWKAMKQAHLATPPLSTHPVSSPSSSLYSSAELMPLAAEFRVSCQNSAGLEKSEFHTLLSRRCPGISRDHANLLFSASLHTSGGTVLTFTTYLRTLFVLTQGTPTQKAEMAFLVIDLNRDTVITIDELYSLATSFEWFSRGSFLSSNQEPIVSSYGSTTAMQTSCEDFLISIITAGGTEMDSERRVSRKLVVTMDHFVRAMIAEPILLTRLGIPQLCQPGSDAKPSARTRTKSPSRAKSPNRAQPPSGN